MQTSLRVLLVAYDNEMVINFFPQGLAYIAAVLVENGYDVEIYNQDKILHFLLSNIYFIQSYSSSINQ
jgi:hypothetical protein